MVTLCAPWDVYVDDCHTLPKSTLLSTYALMALNTHLPKNLSLSGSK